MNKSIVRCKTKKCTQYKMKYDKYVELSDEQHSSLEKSKRISNLGYLYDSLHVKTQHT
jgi:hypothetical protein